MSSMMDYNFAASSTSADPSYSVEPLLEALSSSQDHLIEGGISILQPPFYSWFLSRAYQPQHNRLPFPCARSYEGGWTLHCVVRENLLTPQEWHEFMTVLQSNLWKFKWTQFSLIFGPVGIMALMDLFGKMTELAFFILAGSIVCVGMPLAAYNRHAFHRSMEYLVNEWRLKFLENNRVVEYRHQTAFRFCCGYLECTESHILIKRQSQTQSQPPPIA